MQQYGTQSYPDALQQGAGFPQRYSRAFDSTSLPLDPSLRMSQGFAPMGFEPMGAQTFSGATPGTPVSATMPAMSYATPNGMSYPAPNATPNAMSYPAPNATSNAVSSATPDAIDFDFDPLDYIFNNSNGFSGTNAHGYPDASH